ncbi:MAG: archaellin/type IV pilin N-terminal domain-containing protein [Thermoplasmata archaeon]
MVAITVVLAATVYLMVSGYMTGPTKPSLYASLTEQQPIPSPNKAILVLSMSSPASIPITDLHVIINSSTTISFQREPMISTMLTRVRKHYLYNG